MAPIAFWHLGLIPEGVKPLFLTYKAIRVEVDQVQNCTIFVYFGLILVNDVYFQKDSELKYLLLLFFNRWQ